MIKYITAMNFVNDGVVNSEDIEAFLVASENIATETTGVSDCVQANGCFDININIDNEIITLRGNRIDFMQILKAMEQNSPK